MGANAPTNAVVSTAVNTGGVTTTTSTISTIAQGDALFIFAFVTRTGGFTDTATATSNFGFTVDKVIGALEGDAYGVLFVAYGTATAGSGTVSITFNAAPSAGRYVVNRVTGGQDGTNPVVTFAEDNGTGTGGSIAWSPEASVMDAQLVSLSFWGHNTAEATAPDATGQTWTELTDTATTKGMETQYLLNVTDATHTATWATSSLYVGIVCQLENCTYTGILIDDEPKYAYGSGGGDEDGELVGPGGVWALVN